MRWPGPDGSLRELVSRGVLAILEELEVIRYEMEKNEDRSDIIYQVASLAEGLKDLEDRVSSLEGHKNTVSWLLGLSGAMSFGVLLAYIIGLLK
jgi:hypothetical protein